MSRRVSVAQIGQVANLLELEGWHELTRSFRMAAQPAWTILRRQVGGTVQVVRVRCFHDGRYRARVGVVSACADGCRHEVVVDGRSWSSASFDEWDASRVAALVEVAVRNSVTLHGDDCRFAA